MSRTITISSCSAAKVTSRWRAGSSCRPEKSSSYMEATRDGVASRPSRSGSSPMATSSSCTAARTRSTSTLTDLRSLIRALVAVDGVEVAVALGHIEAVAHDELGWNGEADVLEVELDPLLALLDQEGADLDALGLARVEIAAQVVEREPAVDDVLHHQHVTTLELGVEVLDDAHHARGLGGAPVGGHGHEVDVDRQGDGAAEVAHEEHGALEHGDEERGLVGVVPGDVGAQLGDPCGEVVRA